MVLLAGQRLTAELLNAEHPQVEYGQATVNCAAGAGQTVIVTFGTPFAAVPHINTSAGNGRLTLSVAAITTTGFNFGANNWSPAGTGTVPIYWQAVEKL